MSQYEKDSYDTNMYSNTETPLSVEQMKSLSSGESLRQFQPYMSAQLPLKPFYSLENTNAVYILKTVTSSC